MEEIILIIIAYASYFLGNCPVERLRSIVLDSKGVYQAGEVRDLCPRVEELHISSNHITHYTDVSHPLISLSGLLKNC